MGFILLPEAAETLIDKNPKLQRVIKPYLNGQDLNSSPVQCASRWAITFYDWPLDRGSSPSGYEGPVAADYPECLSIIEELVKPERQRRKPNGDFVLRQPLPLRWWQHAEKRTALYASISKLSRALAVARVSKHVAFSFIKINIIASEQIVVIAEERAQVFSTLQSSFHEIWAREYQSSLETRGRYTPSDCLDTFPFPSFRGPELNTIGETYHSFRAAIMVHQREGLTDLYNRYQNCPAISRTDSTG
jgi:hypothetical protein